jgi:hypothetical protein
MDVLCAFMIVTASFIRFPPIVEPQPDQSAAATLMTTNILPVSGVLSPLKDTLMHHSELWRRAKRHMMTEILHICGATP